MGKKIKKKNEIQEPEVQENKIIDKIKSPLGIVIAFVITFSIIFLISVIYKNNSSNQFICPQQAQIAKELLTSQITYILTLFSGSFAILAIIFSMIQYHKDYEEVLSILFEETYLFPYFGFVAALILYSVGVNTLFNLSVVDIMVLKSIIIPISIGFFLEIILLFWLVYRIYSLQLNDAILIKYIEKAKEIIDKISPQDISIKEKKDIDKYNRIFFQSLESSLYSLNYYLIDKITEFYFYSFKKEYFSYTNSFRVNINKIFYSALENNKEQLSNNVLFGTIDIIDGIIQKTIKVNPDLLITSVLINIPLYFYLSFCNKRLQNSLLTSRLLKLYYSTFLSYNDYLKHNSTNHYTKFNITVLNSFAEFQKIALDYKDTATLKHGFELLSNIKSLNENYPIIQDLFLENYIRIRRHKFGLYSWCLDLYLRNNYSICEYNKFQSIIDQEQLAIGSIDVKEVQFLSEIGFGTEYDIWNLWINPPSALSQFRFTMISNPSYWLLNSYVVLLLANDFNSLTKVDSDNFIQHYLKQLNNIQLLDQLLYSLRFIEDKHCSKISEMYNLTEEKTTQRINFLRGFFTELRTKYLESQKTP